VGQTVKLSTAVDPNLLGGLVVRLGSRMIDASLRTKLHQLELALRGAA
jgi:F-type H+-transporting ATPase subunit delta